MCALCSDAQISSYKTKKISLFVSRNSIFTPAAVTWLRHQICPHASYAWLHQIAISQMYEYRSSLRNMIIGRSLAASYTDVYICCMFVFCCVSHCDWHVKRITIFTASAAHQCQFQNSGPIRRPRKRSKHCKLLFTVAGWHNTRHSALF